MERKRKSTTPSGKKKKKPKQLEDLVEELNETPSLDDMFHNQVSLVGVYDTPEEMMKDLHAPPPPPPPTPEDDNEGFKRMVRMATIFQSPGFQNPKPQPPPSKVDYMVCPCHEVRLEDRQSQKGWHYVKCPRQPCLLFCAKDKAPEYMREVYRQPHPDVIDMWRCLLCYCREPATLQQSHSQDNPDRLFVTCSKKRCNFFRWADQPLGASYWTWFHNNPHKKADKQAKPPTRDAEGYPKSGYDIPGPAPQVQPERSLTEYEKQLLKEIQDLKNQHELIVAPSPPPPKYSDHVETWQKSVQTDGPTSGLF